VAEIDDQTLIRADIARKAIAQVKQAAAGLLQRTLPTDRAEALAEKLATGTWTHGYSIWATTAKELGLPVRTDMPNEVLELMSLLPAARRTQGGRVEYPPAPTKGSLKEGP
jgi:Serine dehydrogenase proteinase